MTFASVVLDIPTRALDAAFDYAVPAALEAEAAAEASSCSGSLVGCTVLVPFSHRHVVGYVVALSSEPPAGVDPSKILEVERILASSAFDEASAEVARWIAREYSCPLCEAIRPFLAPGGIWISSGIIEGRQEEVRAAIEQAGFTILEHRCEEEWHCYIARLPR